MSAEYVVVKIHNFDIEASAVKFDDYRKATAYLHWLWECCYNDALADDEFGFSLVDERHCYHEENYAKVQLVNGDYTEFQIILISKPDDDFPSDWESYVCVDE